MFEIIFTAFVATLIVQTNDCAQAPACPKLIKTCERGKISFYLYKELSQPPEELILGDANSIKNAPFIPKANFKILIHGYTGSRDGSPAMVNLRREYLKVQNKFNILVVDWGPLAVDGCYFETAFPSVPLVGKCCTDLVNSILQNRPEITADQFHCIGWSMGAHICARFGVHFRPRIIPRITDCECPKPISTCERGKISFYLYKELSKPYEELILYDENSIKNATFIQKADFKILIHGYTGSKDRPQAMVDLRNEYLKLQKKFNIVVVDWGPMAVLGCYFDTAFHCMSLIGRCVAEMINSILQYKPEITVDQFHVIGWSMGAQVCARFGVHFRPKIVPRITGLDPAFPKFEWPFTVGHNILNRHHAKFVDVLHSNIGISGVYFSNAHYDIYLNKGTFQPGCGEDLNCSHRRATEVFAESINSKVKFMARKCDHNSYYVTFRKCDGDSKKYIEVGEYCKPPVDEKDTGTYYLKTNHQSPFAIPIPPENMNL